MNAQYLTADQLQEGDELNGGAIVTDAYTDADAGRLMIGLNDNDPLPVLHSRIVEVWR